MWHPRLAAATIVVGFLPGCTVFIKDTALNPPPHELLSRTPSAVEVYSSAPPPRPHRDVQLMTVDSWFADRTKLVELLRNHAAQLGCDAIFINTIKYEHAQATCIVYAP